MIRYTYKKLGLAFEPKKELIIGLNTKTIKNFMQIVLEKM